MQTVYHEAIGPMRIPGTRGGGAIGSGTFLGKVCPHPRGCLVRLFQAESILPACQCDHVPCLLIVVGGLPHILSLVVNRSCGATDDGIERLFIGEREPVPSWPHVDPQQLRQTWRTVHPKDALVGGTGQCGFGLLRIAGRCPRPSHPDGREQHDPGNQANRQGTVACLSQ